MMRISPPGASSPAFSTLDALIALFIISLAWAAVLPVVRTSTQTRESLQTRFHEVAVERSEREGRSWGYGEVSNE